MNATQMTKMIGKTGWILGNGIMTINVRIMDVKVSYGQVRYHIEPLSGSGSTWINADSITLHED